jgi:hypothetical protein
MESLDKSFGYLGKDGYCYMGKCHVFPIAVGECASSRARRNRCSSCSHVFTIDYR